MRMRLALDAKSVLRARQLVQLFCLSALAHGATVPQITGITPDTVRAGGPDLTLTIRGSDFASGATVLANGNSLGSTFVSSSQMTAVLPRTFIAQAVVLEVFVSNPDRLISNRVLFNVRGPSITDVRPSLTAGITGVSLEILGDGFEPGATVVWEDARSASQEPVILPVQVRSPERIMVPVPDRLLAKATTVFLHLVNPDGTPSNSAQVSVQPAIPVIVTLDPGGFAPGGPDFPLTVKGYGYLPGAVVLWNEMPLTTEFDNGGQLRATVPGSLVASVGTVSVKVRNPDGIVSVLVWANIFLGAPNLSRVVNAASYMGTAVAPGEIVAVFYSSPGPNKLMPAELDTNGNLVNTLGGIRVTFDGIPAPLLYASSHQAAAVVPYGIAGRAATLVQVSFQGQLSNSAGLPVSEVAPGVFTQDASGGGPGSILNEDYSLNTAGNPALRGSYISVYATGEGLTNPAGIDGKPATEPYPRPLHSITATVGGINAEIQYAGGVPGLLAGLIQVNVKVPDAVTAGDNVPVVLTIGGVATRPDVTAAIR